MFHPSRFTHAPARRRGWYGAEEQPGLLERATELVQQAAPALSLAQELLGKSTLEKLQILRAKVKNYKRQMKTPPYSVVPGTAWYRAEITKMQGQIKALEVEAAQDASASADYSLWRQLTSVGGVVGIGLGLAGIYFVVVRANAHGA